MGKVGNNSMSGRQNEPRVIRMAFRPEGWGRSRKHRNETLSHQSREIMLGENTIGKGG